MESRRLRIFDAARGALSGYLDWRLLRLWACSNKMTLWDTCS